MSDPSPTASRFVESADGVRIAYRVIEGRSPAVVFLPGFNSVMTGTKARFLESRCASTGQAFIRFDYRGHGESGGGLADGTIRRWRDDARAVLDAVAPERTVLVGSSMGGWVMLLLARELGRRVAGLVGVAAAPDYTRWIPEGLTVDQRRALRERGVAYRPSRYGDGPYPLTQAMLDDGSRHLVLGQGPALECPVHLLHGTADPDLPWRRGLEALEGIDARTLSLTLVKAGDHRLSRPADLSLLWGAVREMLG